jgi:RNA polymerase sigma-70 factor, ECF subfamily
MVPIQGSDFTALLAEWQKGNLEARDSAIAMVYQQLRRLAQYHLQNERGNHTLQATALVHEAYLRLFGEAETDIKNRAHFFALIGRQMCRILVDHGRALRADKREGGRVKLSLEEIYELKWEQPEELIALGDALERLERAAPRAAAVVQLRFFCGLVEKDIAEMLHISLSTVKREWSFAKAFIYNHLTNPEVISKVEKALKH